MVEMVGNSFNIVDAYDVWSSALSYGINHKILSESRKDFYRRGQVLDYAHTINPISHTLHGCRAVSSIYIDPHLAERNIVSYGY